MPTSPSGVNPSMGKLLGFAGEQAGPPGAPCRSCVMSIMSIPAHFEGEHVRLDEDVPIPRDAQLIVTVVAGGQKERQEFLKFATRNLARAYEGDDVEYSLSDCVDE